MFERLKGPTRQVRRLFTTAYRSRYTPARWVYQAGMLINSQLPESLKKSFELDVQPGEMSAVPKRQLSEEKGLLIAPNNWAGAAGKWAAAAATIDGVDAANVQYDHGTHLRYSADAFLDEDVVARSAWWARKMGKWIHANVSHVLMESARPFLGNMHLNDPTEEVRWLQSKGIKVGLLWHGSDVRSPVEHLKNVPGSYFNLYPDDGIAFREGRVQQRRQWADGQGLPEFVSTPGLLPYRPQATWLPQAFDEELWREPAKVTQREKPLVVHVPSHGFIKGTDTIRQVCEKLAAEGILDYQELSGLQPEEMPAVIGNADMVVDQIGEPNYGAAAIEAMRSGKVVLGDYGKQVGQVVKDTCGLELPMVDVQAGTLETVLRGLAPDRKQRLEIAELGPKYASKVHSRTAVASVLEDSFLSGSSK